MASSARWVLALALILALCGCTDLRDYDGAWTGGIVINPYLRLGFESDTRLTLAVDRIDRGSLSGRMTLGPPQAATAGFTDVPLVPIEQSTNDVLGDLTFEGEPLATYLFWAMPDDPSEGHALVIVSAHPKRTLQVRILRRDLYGVFRLNR
ncbi:MAG: hypothetical protein RBU30_15870 [Polyangia bacterium]|jgi:hypothetical protein|nr:hypothetical protein [Polyangia bacterium]